MDVTRNADRGFTLAELLIVVALGAILLTIGVPAFRTLIQNTRLDTATHRLLTHLQTARSEAIKRNDRVILCPSRDGKNCNKDYDWTDGWLMFASKNMDRERQPDEPVVTIGNALAGDITLLSSKRRRRIIYQPVGFASGTNATFTFCDPSKTVEPKVICLSNTGRPRISRKNCSGGPIQCP